jgi:predicted dehydrogenase
MQSKANDRLSRRSFVGNTALIGGTGLIGIAASAQAAGTDTFPLTEPRELTGVVDNGRVTMPTLSNPSDAMGQAPNPDPIDKRLGVAVVGLGRLSLVEILPAFGRAKHVRIAALVSGDRDKARVIGAQYGVPERNLYDYDNFDRIRDNPEIDIVYIVLPNAMHMEFTIRAARAGKHVLCEKPMATNVRDAQAMVDACREAGRKLMIAYRCQYEPHHRAVIAMARSKEFGALRLISAVNGQNNADNGQWRHNAKMSGGGALPDVGVYCLSAARYITGEEPIEISARITCPRNDRRFAEVEDIASFNLLFPSGVVADCAAGYSFHDSRHLRVQAEAAWFGLDPAFGYEGIRMNIGRRAGNGDATETRRLPSSGQFTMEMDHFAEAIATGVTPHTPGEEGLQDQKLVAAIYEAAAGGSVVKWPATTGLDITRGPAPRDQT